MRYFFIAFLIMVFPTKAKAVEWYNADRSSAHFAPLPSEEKRAVVQIYAARAFAWRGWFAVHTWIATKPKDGKAYTVYQVVGWRTYRGLPVVSIAEDVPDRKWFGNEPEMLFEIKGDTAEKMIPDIMASAKSYPYQDFYRLFPGPNSNSFISHIIRHTPGITIELPPHAIGKDWIDNGKFFAPSESKTGYQFSVFGLLGLTVGLAEGVEVNLLGMTFGVDVLRPALKLPFIGRIGLKDRPVYGQKAEPTVEKSAILPEPHVTPGEIKPDKSR